MKMLKKTVSTLFTAAVALVSAAVAFWLTVTGHTLQVGGLLIAMGGVLGAVMFGFRLAEGVGPDRLSIWAGPLWAMSPTAPAFGKPADAMPNPA
jgi:hypothetical protein